MKEMKRAAILILFLSFPFFAGAQIMKTVRWEYSIQQISPDTYELMTTAYIQKPWHLYGQYFDDGGPVHLVFNFEENESYELIGKNEELTKPIIFKDEIFNIDVQYFSEKALFKQKVKTNGASEIKLNIEGQVCNDNTGMCVMVFEEHTFILK